MEGSGQGPSSAAYAGRDPNSFSVIRRRNCARLRNSTQDAAVRQSFLRFVDYDGAEARKVGVRAVVGKEELRQFVFNSAQQLDDNLAS
jgi:hypothetical protein